MGAVPFGTYAEQLGLPEKNPIAANNDTLLAQRLLMAVSDSTYPVTPGDALRLIYADGVNRISVDLQVDSMDRFRVHQPDFGIYEVFLEDSTRTKESFRNAADFLQVKVNELNTSVSSINKGESFADTFHTLTGYHNCIFIIRSKVEGLCKWLEQDCTAYAKRNGLPYIPAFVNAGDGKHGRRFHRRRRRTDDQSGGRRCRYRQRFGNGVPTTMGWVFICSKNGCGGYHIW